ncbi:hypothetical protein [Streptomyces sp. NPDC020965]|uniref:hypothetical protein n=1 Tax=Streptomyces sp. NPDC020965 TaxID=3365105 RepID=UPI0037A7C4E7
MSPEPAIPSTSDELTGGVAGTSPGEPSREDRRPARFSDSATSHESASLVALVERIPEGWTLATYEGRRYGLTRTTRVGGRSISVLAEELGGPDLISANVYRTHKADHLRACEMPEAKVLAFLRRWIPA